MKITLAFAILTLSTFSWALNSALNNSLENSLENVLKKIPEKKLEKKQEKKPEKKSEIALEIDPFSNLSYVKNELIWYKNKQIIAGEHINIKDPRTLDIYKKAIMVRGCKYVYLTCYYSLLTVMDLKSITPMTLTYISDSLEIINQYTKKRLGIDNKTIFDEALDFITKYFGDSINETKSYNTLTNIGECMLKKIDEEKNELGKDIGGRFNILLGKSDWSIFRSITENILNEKYFPPKEYINVDDSKMAIQILIQNINEEYKLSVDEIDSEKVTIKNLFKTENE